MPFLLNWFRKIQIIQLILIFRNGKEEEEEEEEEEEKSFTLVLLETIGGDEATISTCDFGSVINLLNISDHRRTERGGVTEGG